MTHGPTFSRVLTSGVPVSPLSSAITLDNTLVILSTVAPDAGRYYVQAVNDKNGENKTSQPITLSVESESPHTHTQQGLHEATFGFLCDVFTAAVASFLPRGISEMCS